MFWCSIMLFASNLQSHNKGAVTLQTFQELTHLKKNFSIPKQN